MPTIITTTGTSLLSNASRELNKQRGESFADNELQNYFKNVGAEKASAETKSLLKIASPEDEVVLLYTKTHNGELCAREVYRYLKSKKWSNIRLRELPLEENEAQFERRGLRELVNILIEEITKAQRENQEVIINATGGFKAEIAYTTIVGMIFQVPVKYIYQFFQEPVTFPTLPISWNVNLLLEYEDFFAWIDEEPRKDVEVEQRLKAIPKLERNQVQQLLLPADENDEIMLSAAGDILWKRVAQQRELAELIEDAPPSEIPNADKIASSIAEDKHHFPKGTREFAKKVAQVEAVEEIIGGHFENTTMKRIKKIDDDGSIRLLWADNEKAVNITIRTTARGQAQTLKLRDRYIRPLLK
ncbi:MAG: putative CRISPR-associated protein [Okeania sp. SIO3B5]|uniref:putative CRISPR-associated protein n=1 Tax=Okeania sp. SIO3B5 TaxID=2607811 RepID=UPI00140064BA|nr:putative CRISPR-associated protein [Okeania sp. SIO3B5]NEO54051.1 putative CRISPR-associated protein [Okeania sp. SIO3B5]